MPVSPRHLQGPDDEGLPGAPRREGASAALADLEASWEKVLAVAPRRVVLTDGSDPRVLAAARDLAAGGGVVPVVLGEPQEVHSAAAQAGVDLGGPTEVLALDEALGIAELRVVLDEALARRPALAARAEELRRDPLYLGAAAVGCGHADACVGGSTRSSADVLRAALGVLGPAPGAHCVTSSFLMVLADGRPMCFGDCAVIPEPDPDQLAEIALATAATFATLTGAEPVVALLSFSTKGSAQDPRVQVVREAVEIARARAPSLVLDGELQADAALDAAVARAKAPGSPVDGQANVLIFPNLGAGNIGYKLVERLGQARAIGPLLQGLAAPMNDLSRGCRAGDVRAVSLVSALRAGVADSD